MSRVIVKPAAQLELGAAANWYFDQEPGLGEEFIVELPNGSGFSNEGPRRGFGAARPRD